MARHKLTKRKKAVGGVKRKTHRRKRRMSGIGGGGNLEKQLMKVGGVVLGAIGGREVDNLIKTTFPSITPTMSAVIQAGVGFALPMFVKNNELIEDIGLGMAAQAGLKAAQSFGLIAGPNEDRLIAYTVNGVNGIQMIAGPTSRIGNMEMVAGAGRKSPDNMQHCVY